MTASLVFRSNCHGASLCVTPELTLSSDEANRVLVTKLVVKNSRRDFIERSLAQLYPDVCMTISKILEILQEIVDHNPTHSAAWPLSRKEEMASLLDDEARLFYLEPAGLEAVLDARDLLVRSGGAELHRFDTLNEDRFDDAISAWQQALPLRIAGELDEERLVEWGFVDTNNRRKLQPLLLQPGDRIEIIGCPEDVALTISYESLGETHVLPQQGILVAKFAWLEHYVEGSPSTAETEDTETESTAAASKATFFKHTSGAKDEDKQEEGANIESGDENDAEREADAAVVDSGDPILADPEDHETERAVTEDELGATSMPKGAEKDALNTEEEVIDTSSDDYSEYNTVEGLRRSLNASDIKLPIDLEEDELAIVAESERAPKWLTNATTLSPHALTGSGDFEGLPKPEFWARSDLPLFVRSKVIWQLIEQWQASIPDANRPILSPILDIDSEHKSYKSLGDVVAAKASDPEFEANVRGALNAAKPGVGIRLGPYGNSAAVLLLSGVFGVRAAEFLEALRIGDTMNAVKIVDADIGRLASITA
ncbi:MAG: hypothetical protein QNJ09_04275 [Paracoccaceae bacterium]|nr:hypothetical protein [Paracoccaceae bacterium]